jgi:hypothetical protein
MTNAYLNLLPKTPVVVVGHWVYQAKKEEEQINIVCFVKEN